MKTLLLLTFLATSLHLFSQSEDQKQLQALYHAALTQGKAYDWLNHLSNQIGGRLSGSVQAQQAIAYTQSQLQTLELDRVALQPVIVPKWVRGTPEFAYIETKPGHITNLPLCALGGSVATPEGGLKATPIEVHSIEALKKLGKNNIAGKIVFYNRPLNPAQINPFTAYQDNERYAGVAEAAKYGAVGVIFRSLNLRLDDHPHTGAIDYGNTPLASRIPAAAISTNAAELLSATLTLSPNTQLYFRQHCKQLPDVQSHNLIGEIRGTQYPEEIILVGAHLDSWDLGDGTHHNGAGCVQSMEVLRLLKKTGYQPKHTLRVVLFANGENGLSGAKQYAQTAKNNGEKHLFALESNAGGFTPRGFSFTGSQDHLQHLQQWKSLFAPYLVHYLAEGYSGDNLQPLKNQSPVLAGLFADPQRYFDHHHAQTDAFVHINPRELQLGAATMASLVYLVDQHGVLPTANKNNALPTE